MVTVGKAGGRFHISSHIQGIGKEPSSVNMQIIRSRFEEPAKGCFAFIKSPLMNKNKSFTLVELLVACHPKFREARRRTIRFTLVELLVVMGVILVLLTVLLPSLKTSLIFMNGTMCKNNMKNMGAAIALYTNDWNGEFLGVNGNPNVNGPVGDNRGYCWAERLHYSGYSPAIIGRTFEPGTMWDCGADWTCPEFKRIYGATNSTHSLYYGTQVMMKWNGTGPGNFDENEPVVWHDITNPGTRCIVLEYKNQMHYLRGGPWSQYQLLKLGWPGFPMETQIPDLAVDPWYQGGPNIHFGRPNFLYADFHVGNLSRDEFLTNYHQPKGGGPLLFPEDF